MCNFNGKTMVRVLTINPLNAELNPICHLLALLGGATIVVVSRLGLNILDFTKIQCSSSGCKQSYDMTATQTDH